MANEAYTQKYLKHLVYQGAHEKYGDILPQEVEDRIKMELDVIIPNRFDDYILMLWDIHHFCKTPERVFEFCKNNDIVPPPDGIIPLGPGRGCSTKDHMVLMADMTYKMIQDIVVGDTVITHDGSIGIVDNTMMYNISEDMHMVNIGGQTIEFTADHKHIVRKRLNKNTGKNRAILGDLQWIQTKDIGIGDYMAIPKIVLPDGSDTIDICGNKLLLDSDIGKLFGMYIGNGWDSDHNSDTYDIGIAFHSDHIDKINQCYGLMEKYFIKTPSIRKHYARNSTELVIYSKLLQERMRELFGHGANNKKIPRELMINNKALIAGILYGLIITDGHLDGNRFLYSTTSSQLAMQLQTMLNGVGFIGTIKKSSMADHPNWKAEYRVTVGGNQFNKLMQFVGIDIKSNTNGTSLFREDDMYYYLRITGHNIFKFNGDVYDISVPGNTSYTSNGFATHNSVGGSIVCYFIGIHECDPLLFGLYFERFLNPERIAYPD